MKSVIKLTFTTRLQGSGFQWGRKNNYKLLAAIYKDVFVPSDVLPNYFKLEQSDTWKCFCSPWRKRVLAGYARHHEDGDLPWVLSKILCTTAYINGPCPCHLFTLEVMTLGLSQATIISWRLWDSSERRKKQQQQSKTNKPAMLNYWFMRKVWKFHRTALRLLLQPSRWICQDPRTLRKVLKTNENNSTISRQLNVATDCL